MVCPILTGACAGALQGGGGSGGPAPGKFSKNEAKSCILSEKRGVPGTQEPIRRTRLIQHNSIALRSWSNRVRGMNRNTGKVSDTDSKRDLYTLIHKHGLL